MNNFLFWLAEYCNSFIHFFTLIDKDAREWRAFQLRALPSREWDDTAGMFDSIILLPGKGLHDSGYNKIIVIGCVKGVPCIRLTGHSDVVHFDGIGGYGFNWFDEHRRVPDRVRPSGWQCDCLPLSGSFRFWPNHGNTITAGTMLSSLEVFAISTKG